MRVLLGDELGTAIGPDHDSPTRQSFGDVVVGVALESQGDAGRDERAEALAGRSTELDVDRAVRQACSAVTLGDRVAEHRADGAVDVVYRQVEHDSLAAVDRRLACRKQLPVERALEPVILCRPIGTSSDHRDSTAQPGSG